MTELGPYAAALALAASAWGGFIALTRWWDEPEFRASSRRAGAAAAVLLGLAAAGLAWAAWTTDVRYRFVIPFTQTPGSVTERVASLLSAGPRFLLFLAVFSAFGCRVARLEGSAAMRRRRWMLLHALTLAGLLGAWVATDPWSGGGGGSVFVTPESLEPGAVLAGYLRIAAVAAFGAVFLLLWSGPREIRQDGGLLHRPYVWGAWAWLFLTASILSDYAVVEGRAPTLVSLGWVTRSAAVPWLVGLAFLHAAGLGRRRPRGNLTATALGVALFPLALPLLADAGGRWPWIAGGAGALALALGSAFRADVAESPSPWASLWSRDRVAVGAAIVLAGAGALALGALFADGTLPVALWGALAGLGTLAAALSFVFPAVRGRPQRVALRALPFALVGFVVALLSSFASGDLWFGVGCALAALSLGVAGREILSARPGRSGLWLAGAALAHTGLAVVFIGWAAARLGGQTTAALQPGGLVAAEVPFVGSVQVRYLGLSLYRGPTADKWAASVEVEGPSGRSLRRAEQWAVPGRGEMYHVPATVNAPSGSVDVDLAEILSGRAEHVRLAVTVRPLAGAFWIGALLIAMGAALGLAASTPRGRPSP